jgi:hypothetical protein
MNVRVTIIAENMLTIIPIAKVIAKPLIILVPNHERMRQVINEETFESRIESQARVKPSSIAASRVRPLRSSSFKRSKMRMLASTAIPIERIKPAIPASVNVIGQSLKIARMTRV